MEPMPAPRVCAHVYTHVFTSCSVSALKLIGECRLKLIGECRLKLIGEYRHVSRYEPRTCAQASCLVGKLLSRRILKSHRHIHTPHTHRHCPHTHIYGHACRRVRKHAPAISHQPVPLALCLVELVPLFFVPSLRIGLGGWVGS